MGNLFGIYTRQKQLPVSDRITAVKRRLDRFKLKVVLDLELYNKLQLFPFLTNTFYGFELLLVWEYDDYECLFSTFNL